MDRLFLELYLDEDVSVLIAELLRARGFQATTTLEAGQIGRRDEEQLAYATSRRMALFTHNRADFERLAREYFESGRTHFRILYNFLCALCSLAGVFQVASQTVPQRRKARKVALEILNQKFLYWFFCDRSISPGEPVEIGRCVMS